ncbi:MAG: M48 family metalloprotease, partial [Clostridia bacterium]|nr:M48 family metalloprotease [Clostridia bacterium]
GFIRSIVETGRNYVITLLTILVSSTSRKEEFKADKVAYKLGYGEALLSALYKLYDIEMSDKKKLLEKLQSSHPKTAFRIEALEKMFECEEVVA